MRAIIIEAAARALFVQAYASQQEELESEGYESANCAGSGEDWTDVAPATTPDALDAARELIHDLEQRNNASLDTLVSRAINVDGLEDIPDGYYSDFGHYVAMQAVGHGVSWFDDHARFELVIPHTEFYL